MTEVHAHQATALDEIFALDMSTCDVTVCLASVPQDETVPRFRLVDLSPQLTETFRDVIIAGLERNKREWHKRDLVLHTFAVASKLDSYEVEYLDLSTYSTIAKQIEPLAMYQSIANFQEEEDFVAHLRFYVIIVQPPSGGPIYYYRYYTHQKLLSRSPYFGIRLLGNQYLYDRVTEPIFLFDKHIDCLSRGNDMFIFEKNNFYHIFRFFEELLKTAKEILEMIEKKDLIHNFERFARDCERDHNKMLKLKNISMQPYLSTITIEDMKKIIRQYGLSVPVVRVGGKERVHYDPRDRWGILNLLDDTYLDSAMTKASYMATGKRGLRRGP